MNDVVVRSPLPAPGAPMPHYVSEAPFDPRSIEKLTADQERIYLASQWRLMWWKFRKHRLAVWSGVFLGVLYFSILIPHVLLAALVLPLALVTTARGLRSQFDRHVRIARWTLPIWLYVSVTGVVIYLMLYW